MSGNSSKIPVKLMRQIQFNRYGGPELMHLAPLERPSPGPRDILVEVKAASVNPVDWGIRNGQMKWITGCSFPRVMGKDFAGIIVQVGADVIDWKVGDAVLGCVPWKTVGSFASMALVRGSDIVSKPGNLTFPEAATLPTIGLTAWHGLFQGAKVQSGQSVLVNGAAGGVGRVVVQIAKSEDAKVTARVGPRSFECMKNLGAETILDYHDPLLTDLDASFDIVFDCNGSIASQDADRLLKPNGVVVDITINMSKVLRYLFYGRQKLAFGTVDQKTLQEVTDLAASGKLRLDIGAEVSIEDSIPFLTRLEGGERIDGKLVIIP